MKSDLDVWTVQKNKNEMKDGLMRVNKDSEGNILYLNCRCKFKIGNKRIESRAFDKCFYSEDSDALILFAADMIDEKEIVEYLQLQNIKYTTIRFKEIEDKYQKDEPFPDVRFVRDERAFIKALEEAISEGYKEYKYFKDVESIFHLNYLAEDTERYEIEGRFCKGLVSIGDKLMLFVNQRDDRNLKERDIIKIISRYDLVNKNISKK